MPVEAQTIPLGLPFAVPTDPIWRLSVVQYHEMVRSGILTENDPVELPQGWLVTKMPKSPAHRLTTQLIRDAVAGVLPPGWHVDAREPITLADSEPEPDVAIVRGERPDYVDRHPRPQDVALVVEVADATLHRDRTLKQRLYAAAEIPSYWVVNLPAMQFEVYTNPSGATEEPGYARRQEYGLSDEVPLIIEGREAGRLVVHELLP